MAFSQDFFASQHILKSLDDEIQGPWMYFPPTDDCSVDGYFDPVVNFLKEGQLIVIYQQECLQVVKINKTAPFVITSVPSDNLKDKDDL